MKKLILIALTAVVMAGCVEQPNRRYYKENAHRWIEVIDSCEYIVPFGHKGNCKFCEQRRKAEIREIINELKNK